MSILQQKLDVYLSVRKSRSNAVVKSKCAHTYFFIAILHPFFSYMNIDLISRSQGRVIDICDSIVSVSGLSSVFSGELVRFQSPNGDLAGFV